MGIVARARYSSKLVARAFVVRSVCSSVPKSPESHHFNRDTGFQSVHVALVPWPARFAQEISLSTGRRPVSRWKSSRVISSGLFRGDLGTPVCPPCGRLHGFSLVELIVVIGIIAMLIAFLLPTMNTARQQMVTVKCMSQMRELGNAFQMYANDNRGWMASSDTCGPLNPETFVGPSQVASPGWTGWVDGGSTPQAISNGTLWPYISKGGKTARSNDPALAIYHCPNDTNPYRLRSYSMNGYIDTGLTTSPVTNGYKVYRISQVRNASAAILFAEDPDPRAAAGGETMVAAVGQWNLNGWDQNPLSASNGTWDDLLAAWHRGGANFTFLDGHAEFWKFIDPRTVNYVKNDPNWPSTVYTTPNDPDLKRISAAIVTWPEQRPQQ
jgi:prepilin-type processing-associated H-X9-DG protein/prepilin-type N-terminal cleavage/methylation domain-containing protein